MASNTFNDHTEDLTIVGITQTKEIGFERSTIVEANKKGITFFSGNRNRNSKTYKIRLSPAAVNVMNAFLTAIHDNVELLKTGNLTEKYSLPLGARVFLEIDPNFRCVSIRRFFRPKDNPDVLLPGFNGIGLKLKEFENLQQLWYPLIQSVPWEEAECCYFTNPKHHTYCNYCWN